MKIKFIIALLITVFITPFAIAADSPDGSGYFVGLNLGYADRQLAQNSFFQNNPSSITTAGFAGRASVGYSFGPHFALGSGFVLLPNAQASFPTYQVQSSSYIFDFLFRASIPFQHNFSVYGKLGMAYVNTNLSVTSQAGSSANEFRPVIAAGIAYAINQAISVNLEWYNLIGGTNSLNGYAQTQQVNQGGSYATIPSVNLYTVGIVYLF